MSLAVPAVITPALSAGDLNHTINHEPRILDERLAAALGFERPRKIRDLIRRHRKALERFGEVRPMAGQTSDRGGRPGRAFWLNRKQALLVCMKSETARAEEITMQVIDVYDEVTSARAVPPPDPNAALPRRRLNAPISRELLETYAAWLHGECIRTMEELNPGVPAHLQAMPMSNPGWWYHEARAGEVLHPPSARAEGVLRLARCPIPRPGKRQARKAMIVRPTTM